MGDVADQAEVQSTLTMNTNKNEHLFKGFQNLLHMAVKLALNDEDYEAGKMLQEARKILRLNLVDKAEIISMMSECEKNIIVDNCYRINVQIINDTLVDI